MKKVIIIIAIIVILIICAMFMTLNNKKSVNNIKTEIDSNQPNGNIVINELNKEIKYNDIVYNTEIDFSDVVPENIDDANSIVLEHKGRNFNFTLNGFEGKIKSVRASDFEGAGEIHELVLLNTDGKVFIANADGLNNGGDLNLIKIDFAENVKSIGHTNSYMNNAGKILLLTDKDDVYAIEDGDKVKQFDFEYEKKYGKILKDLVGTWKLDKNVTSNDFENTYVFGADLQFKEHGDVSIGTPTDGIHPLNSYFRIVPDKNIIVLSYEYGQLESVNLEYIEATNNENSKIIFYDDNRVMAVWTKVQNDIVNYTDNYDFEIAQNTYSDNHKVYTVLDDGNEDINRSNYLTENGQILTPESYGSEVKLSGFEGTVKSAISIFNGDFGLEWPLYVLNTNGDVFYTLACVGENTYKKLKIKDNSKIVEIAISDKRNDTPVEKEMDNGLYPHNALVSREYFEILGKTVDGQIILLDEFVLSEEEITDLGTLSKKIYSVTANNLQVVVDHTKDFFNYEESNGYDHSIYSGGEEIAVKYIEEAQEYANKHPEENVVVYISLSDINYNNNTYYLYTGRYSSNDDINTLKEKVTSFVRSNYAHEPMNEKTPRYDTEEEYNIALSDAENEYKVNATGAIYSITCDISTGEIKETSRLYPGEI